jgi:hypothetical protein
VARPSLWSELIFNLKHVRAEIAGRGLWRMGCNECELWADYGTREQADKAARLHDEKHHGGANRASVYVPTWPSRFWDQIKDQD